MCLVSQQTTIPQFIQETGGRVDAVCDDSLSAASVQSGGGGGPKKEQPRDWVLETVQEFV